MKWPTAPIEEIAFVKGGKRLPKGHDFASAPTDHLYIRARDIGGNRITITEPAYISDHTFSAIKAYTVVEGDSIVTIVGANIGDVGFVSGDFEGANLTENAARIRANKSVCDPKFLSLQLSTSRAKERFQLLTGGSAQGKLGLFKIKAFDVVLPPLSVQQRVADVLSTYDDLIENNRRRMALLEEAARQLYREWFVRLRFPGHEHTRITDGVPEGWERKRLDELAESTMGQSPPSKLYNEDGEGLPFHQGVADFGDRFVSHRIYTTAENRIAEPGDILCSVRAPVGRLNLTTDKIVIGRGLAAVRSRHAHQSFLFYQLNVHFFKEDLIGAGAIFASVSKKELFAQEMLTPSKQLIALFEETSHPIDDQLRILTMENEKLRAARDLLLPRLMSGEIAV